MLSCEYCPYHWQEHVWDEEKEEMIPVEPRPSCHFNHDEMMGIPAPCEEEDYYRNEEY